MGSTDSRRARLPASARASTQHPSITTAAYNVDVAVYQVKVAEGALYPVLQLQGAANQAWGNPNNLNTSQTTTASITTQLSVPIYQGGGEYATIRQAKETLGQRRLDLDAARDQCARATQAWGQLEAAKAQIEATQAQVAASETRSMACARKPASASAPRWTCSTLNRIWSMRGFR